MSTNKYNEEHHKFLEVNVPSGFQQYKRPALDISQDVFYSYLIILPSNYHFENVKTGVEDIGNLPTLCFSIFMDKLA